LHRARGEFTPDATLHLTPPNDPWLVQLGVPARVTAEPLVLPSPATVASPVNDVSIITSTTGLTDESMTVNAQVTPK
jgi:hypothetical protein